MSRVNLIDPQTATGERKQILESIRAAFGVTPNMFKAVANSTATLASMWGSFSAYSRGTISPKLGEQIAVAVANRNACEYCLAAHTALGLKAGATAQEIESAKTGKSTDPKTAAALLFAGQLVQARGQVSAAEVDAVRGAGFNDNEIVEIVGLVALNIFTNYVNVAFMVPVDFPAVPLAPVA